MACKWDEIPDAPRPVPSIWDMAGKSRMQSVVDEEEWTTARPNTVQSSVFPCTPPYPPAASQMHSPCEISDDCETDICGIYFETAMT